MYRPCVRLIFDPETCGFRMPMLIVAKCDKNDCVLKIRGSPKKRDQLFILFDYPEWIEVDIMPNSRVLRKDNFALNILPIQVTQDGQSKTTGVNRLINASEMAVAESRIRVVSGEDDLPIYIVGDMHGNALKMMAILGIVGAVKLGSDVIQQWADVYESVPPATDVSWRIRDDATDLRRRWDEMWAAEVVRPNDFEQKIIRVLDRCQWNSDFKGQIVFAGDVLHDRGHSDFMTLLLMERLTKRKISYTYILGNHDQGVLYRYLQSQKEGLGIPANSIARDLMASDSSDMQSYDYLALNKTQQKSFKRAYEAVLGNMKLCECFAIGDEYVTVSHCVFQPRLLPGLSSELKTVLGLRNTEESRVSSPDLIDDINRMFSKALASSKRHSALQALLKNGRAITYKWINSRYSGINVAELLEDLSTGDFKKFFSVYGHDLAGNLSGLGKQDLSKSRSDGNTAEGLMLCLDTMVGRPKVSNMYKTLIPLIDSRKKIYPEDLVGFYDGDLLVCSVKSEVKDPEAKLAQTQQALLRGISCYESWYKSLPMTEMKPDYENERKIAHAMISDVLSADNPSQVRLVLNDYVSGNYAAYQGIPHQIKEHRNDLLSYILDSINAAYPPLSLALKIGTASVGNLSFTVDYPEVEGIQSRNEQIIKAKADARTAIRGIGLKSMSQRTGVDVATIKQGLERQKNPSPGVRKKVISWKP